MNLDKSKLIRITSFSRLKIGDMIFLEYKGESCFTEIIIGKNDFRCKTFIIQSMEPPLVGKFSTIGKGDFSVWNVYILPRETK